MLLTQYLMTHEISMEAIDHQFDDKYIRQLEDEFARLRVERITPRIIAESKLPAILKEMTNLTIEFDLWEGQYNASVQFPKSVKNHPFYEDYLREYINPSAEVADVKRKGAMVAGINWRTGKVYGTVTEHPHLIKMGTPFMTNSGGFTVRESVTVLLHEVGHLLSFYEFASRASTGNYLMADITRRLFEAPDAKGRALVIKEAKDQGVDAEAARALENVKTPNEAYLVIFNGLVNKSRSELGVNIYDLRGWEQQADQYVGRWGLGRDYATALNKLNRKFGHEKRSKWAELLGEAMGYIIGVVNPAFYGFMLVMASAFSGGFATAGGAVAGLVALPLLGIALINMVAPWFIDDLTDIYDKDGQRIKVIRKEMVGRLKVAPDNETRRKLIKDIEVVDIILQDYNNNLGLFTYIRTTFYPAGRQAYRSIRSQQLLEHFAQSELHLAAARLENEDLA